VFKKICAIVVLICLLGLYSQAQPQEQEKNDKKIIHLYFPTFSISKTIAYQPKPRVNESLYGIIHCIATKELNIPLEKAFSIFHDGQVLPYSMDIDKLPPPSTSNSILKLVILPQDKKEIPINVYTFWRKNTAATPQIHKVSSKNGVPPYIISRDTAMTRTMMSKKGLAALYKTYRHIFNNYDPISSASGTVIPERSNEPNTTALPT
jgi:hypothetical protein